MSIDEQSFRAINNERRAILLAIVFTALGLIVYSAVAIARTFHVVQLIDDLWHDAMVSREWQPLVVLAKALAVFGGSWITVPIRAFVALWLWRERRWQQLWVWVSAVASAQAVSALAKITYGRPRPDDRLMDSLTASFPSGHATNAAVMGLSLALILAWTDGSKKLLVTLSVVYALIMAWSRTYLRVHWASDVAAGFLTGISCALWSAVLIPHLRIPRKSGDFGTEAKRDADP